MLGDSAPCPRCEQINAAAAPRCVRCGLSFLVDVVADPVADHRTAFTAARAIAALNLPGLDFSHARASLLGGTPFATRLSRDVAHRVQEALSASGVRASVVETPAGPPPAAHRHGSRAPRLLAIFAATCACGLIWSHSDWIQRVRNRFGLGEPSYSTVEIARIVHDSVVTARTKDSLGTAFFIDDDVALTNAHVAGQVGDVLTIEMPDGRELSGRVDAVDDRVDMARMKVPGAHVPPLPLGDATLLQPGERIAFVGTPKGLKETVHEGRIGFVGRNALGTAYLQLDGNVNPGNSGGPVINQAGRVVGIVTLKVTKADDIGLALPIQYASRLAGFTLSPETQARWDAILAKVRAEDAKDVEREKKSLAKPALVSLLYAGTGDTQAVFLTRGMTTPGGRAVTLQVRHDGQELCELLATIESWTKATEESVATDVDIRRSRWLRDHHLLTDLYRGNATMDLSVCPGLHRLTGPGELRAIPVGSQDDVTTMAIDLGELDQARLTAADTHAITHSINDAIKTANDALNKDRQDLAATISGRLSQLRTEEAQLQYFSNIRKSEEIDHRLQVVRQTIANLQKSLDELTDAGKDGPP